jgi:superfamily II DNA or RNA helicase
MRETKILADLLDISSDWDSLKKELEKYNTVESSETKKKTQAGKLFEYFSKYYFQTEPTQKINYKNVWLYDDVPPSILDKLKLPYKDYGIDLILQDVHNKFTAVQCKFKNDETSELSWTKDKLGNAFGLAKNCDRLLIFTNASNVTQVAKKLSNSYEQICYDSLSEITTETFEDIRLVAKGQAPKPQTKKTPKKHQEAAIDKVTKHLEANSRCQLILPCGAGKTLTALWIKEKINSKKTLVLVPSLALLRQIKNDWNTQRNINYDYVCVCSEKDIDKEKEDAIEIKPYEVGGPVTTDSKELLAYLKQNENTVIFSTYQSIDVVVKSIKQLQAWRFDLVISDEAHRTFGSAAKNKFTTVHYDKKIPSKKRIYMTATPKVASKSLQTKLGQDYELLCDMSREDIFGGVAFKMSFAEAIDKGILCQYKIIGVGVSDKEVKRFIDTRQYTGEATADEVAHNFALNHVMKKYNAFHALSFHSRVKWAKDFSQRHLSFFQNVFTRHLEGKDSTAFRNKVLKEFRNSPIGVVANARCLTEGVDVPTIDLIYFCDPKTSKIDIVQSAGRALRIDPSGKKKEGLIVVPIFHHVDQDIEKELSKNEVFNHLVTVIRSLCEHDERLIAEINGIATGKGEKSNKRIELTSIGEEDERIIKIEGFEKRVKKSLFTEIIDRTKDTWEIFFQKFKDYLEKEGTPYIERKNQETKELGRWCAWQRTNKVKGTLSQEKIKQLTEAGFSWTPSYDKWEQRFSDYKEFILKTGKTSFLESDRKRYPKYVKLYNWIKLQRILYNRNQSKYPQNRYVRLIKLGFNFDIDSNEDQTRWLEMFEKLRQFKEINNHCNVSQVDKDPEIKKLGVWLNTQRVLYKGRISSDGRFIKMTPERVKMLENLGVIWNAKDADWNKGFEDLKAFKEKYNHFNIPQSDKLYYRVRRFRLKKDTLTQEQIDKLNSIGFYAEARPISSKKIYSEEIFQKRYNQLLKYKNDFGTINISYKNKKYSGLYHWKKDIKDNIDRLSESQKQRLEQIGIELSLNFEEQKFNQRFEELLKYRDKYGTVRVSGNKYKQLYQWQQNMFRPNKVWYPGQKERLEAIGFFVEFSKPKQQNNEYDFDEIFHLIKEYWTKYQTFHISEHNKEYRKFFNWKNRKNQGLTEERKQKLESIGYFNPENHLKKIKTFSFDERYNQLLTYIAKHGTSKISRHDKENRQLFHWVTHIKRSRILTDDQKKMLNEVGIIVKVSKNSQDFSRTFDQRFKELKAYKDKFGTAHIKRTNDEYRTLYFWTSYIKRRALLTTEQIKRLKSIGFDTSGIEKSLDSE